MEWKIIISEDEEEKKRRAFKEIRAGYWPCEIIRFTAFNGSPPPIPRMVEIT